MRSASAGSSVRTAPASPRAPRFLDGKNDRVAAAPRTGPAPIDCAASSSTGTSTSGIGARRPNRLTGRTARVRERDGGRGGRGVEVGRDRVDVGEHRARAQPGDGAGGGEEGERRGDDLVARAHAQSHERDHQRVGARRDADRAGRAGCRRELALERLDLGAADEAAGVDHAGPGGVEGGAELGVLGGEVAHPEQRLRLSHGDRPRGRSRGREAGARGPRHRRAAAGRGGRRAGRGAGVVGRAGPMPSPERAARVTGPTRGAGTRVVGRAGATPRRAARAWRPPSARAMGRGAGGARIAGADGGIRACCPVRSWRRWYIAHHVRVRRNAARCRGDRPRRAARGFRPAPMIRDTAEPARSPSRASRPR